jgi:hypothetical protein
VSSSPPDLAGYACALRQLADDVAAYYSDLAAGFVQFSGRRVALAVPHGPAQGGGSLVAPD